MEGGQSSLPMEVIQDDLPLTAEVGKPEKVSMPVAHLWV
jgi:hypothetical protein